MLHAMCEQFNQLYSIELHPELYARAKQRFANRSKVQLLQGDSADRIADVLGELNRRAVFWLDGHYSAGNTAHGDLETPVSGELEMILSHAMSDHVILVDDARLFDGTHDYPTLEQVRQRLAPHPHLTMKVEDDVIAIANAH
jgi:hypothetical protein